MVFYDQVTGVPQPGYSVRLTVLDLDTKEKYECNVSDYPGLDDIRDLKRQKRPVEELQQRAEQLKAELPPMMTQLALDVRKVKASKGFLTLVCRLAQVAATA